MHPITLALCVCGTFVNAAAAQTQRIDVDPLSGLALRGYDAVSYFTQAAPVLGDPAYEFYWQGASWYFASKANLDIFKARPDIYAPQFGGYGTMSMARGFVSSGDPLVYRVLDDELFIFYSSANRLAFEAATNTARLRARENWDEMRPTLVPVSQRD